VEGRLLLALGRPARAEKAFRAALESAPEDNRILVHLALCLWKHLRKPEEAYLLLQKVYRRAKSLTRVVSLLADYHWRAGEKDRALGRFKDALQVNPALTLRRSYAELLLRAPNPVRLTRAEALLQPILKENPKDHAATALYALVELGRGQPKTAMTRIKRALLQSPRNLDYRVIQARIAEASGNPKDALAIYEDLLAGKTREREISRLRARLLCLSRITKRCLAAANEILKRFGDPEGYLLQGLAHLQLRKPARAVSAFRKAIAKKKGYAEAHFLLGRTLYHDAAYRKALSSLIRCSELADETARFWPDVHYLLGMSYFKVGNKRLARTHLTKYLSTPGNPDNVETGEQQRTAKDSLRKL
jgi:tetratricopeptide (TPR) repeat protein